MPKDLDKITIKRGKRGDFSPTQSDHYHNHYEFCYLNSGKCRFLLQDSVYQLEKGDLVFITPGDLHHAIYTSNPTCEIIMICFRREDIDWAMLHRIMENRESSSTLHSFMGSIPLLYQEEFVQLLLRMLSEATIIDDYSHHPTEITAALKAARNCPHNRLWCVFQPHTYSRTKSLLKDFAKALTLADKIVLADIYAARETDHLGISSETLKEEIEALGHECFYFPTFDEIENFLLENCINGDLLITMGAGDVLKIGENLLGI